MNGHVVSAALAVAIAASAAPALADAGYYLGVKAGYAKFAANVEIDGADRISARDGAGYGLYGGYKFTDNYAIELEYTDIGTDTEMVNYCATNPLCDQIRGDVDVATYAVYGVYRTTGDIYLKARAGYLYEDIEFSFAGNTYDSRYEGGFVASLGGGVRFGAISVEAEYNYLESDIDFISLGAHYQF